MSIGLTCSYATETDIATKMSIISIFLLFITNRAVHGTSNIEKDILDYFDDETVQSFADKWELYRIPTENAIESVLKETFDNPGLNIHIGNNADALKVSDGFLVYDSLVYVLFRDMYLSRLPRLENPRVVFSIPSNVIKVEASVSKMFVETKYQLFRNISDVVYWNKDAAMSRTSPFNLQQIQNKGQATIIAEHCNLAGFVLATLQGDSVNLGQDNFKLNNCKFSVEISTPGLGSPPLIAPYFAQELGLQLEKILGKPIKSELTSKLKDAVLSSVNTSSTLGNLLPTVRNIQQNIFKKTSNYITEVIKRLNKLTAEENAASEDVETMKITWTDEYEGKLQTSSVSLSNMIISGLDTAYSAHTGGTYKCDSVKIDEAIRYSSLQVRGSGVFKVDESENSFMFSSEVQDFIAYATLPVNTVGHYEVSKKALQFETVGWRSLDINGPNSELVNTYALITGVLLNRVPEIIIRHLSKYFIDANNKIGKPDSTIVPKDADKGYFSEDPQLTEIDNSANFGSGSGEDVDNNSSDNTDYTAPPDPLTDYPQWYGNEGEPFHGNEQESSHNVKSEKETEITQESSIEEPKLLSQSVGLLPNEVEKQFNEPMFSNDFFSSSGEKVSEKEGNTVGDVQQELQVGDEKNSDTQGRKFIKERKIKQRHRNVRMSENEIRSE